ncbi:hypothetical protein [Streptomyces albidus (ex Kaewkla and Franco 2022)]|nr:hypothetical protein [Streptomyces albidus (ex Kaewkla and Franco 2022)]
MNAFRKRATVGIIGERPEPDCRSHHSRTSVSRTAERDRPSTELA